MKHILFVITNVLLVTILGCGSDTGGIAHDLNTPEGAILTLEDAYRARDLEAAVRCKDFSVEAKLMLEKLQTDFSGDQEILKKTAELLELGFRNELTTKGFPDFRDVESTFSDKKPYPGHEEIVQVTEHCRHVSGSTAENQLVVAKTPAGWKVISVPE